MSTRPPQPAGPGAAEPAPRPGPFRSWSAFWFTPRDPLGLHAVRVLAGLLFLAWLLAFAGQHDALFGMRGWFDRRGDYLYELGYEHKGFEEITIEVKIQSKESEEKIREFIKWADRSPPHATLRRAVRLIGIFHLNGRHLTTAVYHPDRTEWR